MVRVKQQDLNSSKAVIEWALWGIHQSMLIEDRRFNTRESCYSNEHERSNPLYYIIRRD
jgi:Fe-S cluster biosynthesis and repair protein YggX